MMLIRDNYFPACELNTSFTAVRYALHIALTALLLLSALCSFGQDGEIEGIVLDVETRQRISRVFVYNPRNDAGGYNNTKGEFSILAKPGDILIAASEGYFPDTIQVADRRVLVFQLKRSSIRIPEVSIIIRRNPDEALKEKQEEFGTAYSKGNRGPLFTVGPSGAGLSIDALYKLISREGKNARRLQEIIERDYRESVIDYRFTRDLVRKTTGLEGDQLQDFMQQYRPSYFFILGSSEYDLVSYIQKSLLQYRRNPNARRLPPLK